MAAELTIPRQNSRKQRAMHTCLPELEVFDFGDQQLVVGTVGSHGCYVYEDQLLQRACLIGCFRWTKSAADFLVVVAPLVSAEVVWTASARRCSEQGQGERYLAPLLSNLSRRPISG